MTAISLNFAGRIFLEIMKYNELQKTEYKAVGITRAYLQKSNI